MILPLHLTMMWDFEQSIRTSYFEIYAANTATAADESNLSIKNNQIKAYPVFPAAAYDGSIITRIRNKTEQKLSNQPSVATVVLQCIILGEIDTGTAI